MHKDDATWLNVGHGNGQSSLGIRIRQFRGAGCEHRSKEVSSVVVSCHGHLFGCCGAGYCIDYVQTRPAPV